MDAIRPWLYVGKFRDTLSPKLLAAHHIQAMLQLADLVEHSGVVSLYLPVQDADPIPPASLDRGMAFVRQQRHLDHRILIACGAGINRSCAFAVASLKQEEGLDLLQAFRDVRRRHPEALPHRPVWESLCRYYQEDVPYMALLNDER